MSQSALIATDEAPVREKRRSEVLRQRATIWLLSAALGSNCILAIANAHFMAMNATLVTLLYIAVAAMAAAVWSLKPVSNRSFLIALGVEFLLILASSLANASIDLSLIYKIAIIPIFILLGQSVTLNLVKILSYSMAVVISIAAVELIYTDLYIWIFDPVRYYLATRAWVTSSSSNVEANIYLGSYRPGGTVFGFSHRAGSIFLEPLSLGYFGIICVILILNDPSARIKSRIILICLSIFVGLLSDSRLSVGLMLFLVASYPAMRRLPPFVVFVAPFILFAAVIFVYAQSNVLGVGRLSDLGGRLSITFSNLSDITNPIQILFGGFNVEQSGDSAISVLMGQVGIFGMILFYLLASGALLGLRRCVALSLSALLYLFVGSLFGGAIFSLKTAALLGFGIGSLARVTRSRESMARQSGPLEGGDQLVHAQ